LKDLFHTRIGPALADPTTWAGLAGAITAAAALPSPFNFIVALIAVPAIVLKGGRGATIDKPSEPA